MTRPTKNRKPARQRSGSRPKTKPASKTKARSPGSGRPDDSQPEVAESELLREISEQSGVSPIDSGGDVDADWQRAQSSGEEAVGGSVATPDQDVVDEIARPLGVERSPDAEVISSEEMLSSRDRRRWRIEQHTDEEARQADEP